MHKGALKFHFIEHESIYRDSCRAHVSRRTEPIGPAVTAGEERIRPGCDCRHATSDRTRSASAGETTTEQGQGR